jgi:hypothetical protein
MFADEANLSQSENAKHFVYGGVFLPAESAKELDREIGLVRTRRGFLSSDPLKSNTNDRPAQVDAQQHRDAKNELLELASECGVIFCAYAVPHGIAKSKDGLTRLRWGADTLLERFDRFCDEKDTTGVALFDRWPVGDSLTTIRKNLRQA